MRASAIFPLLSQALDMTQPDYAGTVALGYNDAWILGEIDRPSSLLSEDDARFLIDSQRRGHVG